MSRLTHSLGTVYVTSVILFLLSPILTIMILSFSRTVYLQFPPDLASLQWYRDLTHNSELLASLKNSVIIAGSATVIAAITGTLAALGARRFSEGVQSILSVLFLAPLIVPYVVLATGMTRAYSFFGLRGIPAIILAHSAIAFPYVFLLVQSGLQLIPEEVEEAAKVLGATPVKTLLHVTIPMLKAQVVGGALFAFVASFGEFIIAYMLGSVRSQTLPVYIYASVREKTEPSITALLSLLTVVFVFLGLYLSRYYARRVQ